MKFINKKLFINIFILLLLVLPLLSFSAIIGCGNGDADPCDYDDFVTTVNGFIDWVVGSALFIFTISAIWGGFLYMTSGVNPGNKAKAKNILYSTVIGFIIVLCSWLIVYTILDILVDKNQEQDDIFRFIGDRDDSLQINQTTYEPSRDVMPDGLYYQDTPNFDDLNNLEIN